MKTLHNPSNRREIEARLSLLTPDQSPIWGKMSVSEMVPHITDQLRLALGEKNGNPQSSFLRRTLQKWAVLYGTGFPKNTKTIPEMDAQQKGTPATQFEQDRLAALGAIQNFCIRDQRKGYAHHPYFGNLTYSEWGRLAFLHIDHHLKQFGI